jgi:hypothetical protein
MEGSTQLPSPKERHVIIGGLRRRDIVYKKASTETPREKLGSV